MFLILSQIMSDKKYRFLWIGLWIGISTVITIQYQRAKHHLIVQQISIKDSTLFELEDIDEAIIRPSLNESDSQIFFVETFCTGTSNCSVTLKDRVVCAIESAARLHPAYKIYVLIVEPHSFGPHANPDLIQKLLEYPNVFLRKVDLMKYGLKTPLEDFFNQKLYLQSKPNFIRAHMSDILRFLTMWKYGGVYLDTDVVVVRNLEPLGKNWIARELRKHISSGALGVSNDTLGREFSQSCLEQLNQNYNGQEWGSNGPILVTHVLQKLCKVQKTAKMSLKACHGFRVWPYYLLKPVESIYYYYYFQEKYTVKIMELVKKSYVAHIFGFSTTNLTVQKTANVGYALLAKEYCPDMFNSEPSWF